MDQPINDKIIEIKERKFKLNKMDARTGSYMLFKVTGILGPMFKKMSLEDLENLTLDKLNIGDIIDSLCSLSEKDFKYIQDNCLKVVEEILPAGPAKILDKNGSFGVLDIEFDTGLIMALTVQSLVFNVMGFFAGSPLTSMMKGLNIFQQDLQM